MWPQYLGEYKPQEEEHNGAQVFVNSEGLFLYVNDNGDWSANTIINDRGVLRGDNQGAVPCLTSVTQWRYWDDKQEKWEPSDISVTCGEYGTVIHCTLPATLLDISTFLLRH